MKTTFLLIRFSIVTLLLCLVVPSWLYGAEESEKNYIRIKTKAANLAVVKGEAELTFETGEKKSCKEGEIEGSLSDGTLIAIITGNATLDADKTIVELNEGDLVPLTIYIYQNYTR